jgi:hypothetical protein
MKILFTNFFKIIQSQIKKFINYLKGLSNLFDNNESDCEWLEKEQLNIKLRNIMTALESLQASVTSLTTTVDGVVTVLNTPHPTESQVQAAADAINAQIARLNTAVGVSAVAPLAPDAATPAA